LAPPTDAACRGSELAFADDFEVGASLEGFVRDYWTHAGLPGSTLTTATPPRTAASDAAGRYRLPDVASVTVLDVLATQPAGYRQSLNGPLATAGSWKACDLFVLSAADVNRQYAIVGSTPTPGTAFVVVELRQPDGGPLEGIAVSSIVLVDADSNPIAEGPYFFGASGDIDTSLLVSTAFAGQARAAFLNVSAVPARLTVNSATPGVGGVVGFSPVASGANALVFGGPD
jgi:hypothetical protein